MTLGAELSQQWLKDEISVVTLSTKVKNNDRRRICHRSGRNCAHKRSKCYSLCSHTLCHLTLEKQLNIILPEAVLIINELTLPTHRLWPTLCWNLCSVGNSWSTTLRSNLKASVQLSCWSRFSATTRSLQKLPAADSRRQNIGWVTLKCIWSADECKTDIHSSVSRALAHHWMLS